MAITSERKGILKKFIKSSADKGQNMSEIKDKLKGFGYSDSDVNDLVSDYSGKKAKTEVAPAISRTDKISFGINYKKLGVAFGGVAVLFLLIFAGFYLFAGPQNCGDDRQCFIENAQQCSPAVLEVDEDGTITRYEVNEACVMTRQMAKLADEEPWEIKLLFENKSMSCPFERGDFDTNLVNTITRGLENCDGDLKDSIYELIIAQYERSLAAI